ncbi:MAG TPA: 1,2-phenylacetyl-CoA epoxidase subunit PaaD [Xanthomonadales bacterium]|nr:1,2-phenylacetyl-CoA epoxidase subunit PaaD [Xanthomonadales bacterium]
MNTSATVISISEPVPENVLQALESVCDPEIPVLTIRDLGILRGVRMKNGEVVVTITPTYSGCPAMVDIRDSIETALEDAGVEQFSIETSLSPAWTTDWMSEEGRKKLNEYGIAPPSQNNQVACPQCGSDDTRLISEFASTACKSLHQCNSCKEPFDYFKCH